MITVDVFVLFFVDELFMTGNGLMIGEVKIGLVAVGVAVVGTAGVGFPFIVFFAVTVLLFCDIVAFEITVALAADCVLFICGGFV